MKDLKGRLLHPSAVRIQNECISVESGKSLKTFIPQPQQGYRFMLLFIGVVLAYFLSGFPFMSDWYYFENSVYKFPS